MGIYPKYVGRRMTKKLVRYLDNNGYKHKKLSGGELRFVKELGDGRIEVAQFLLDDDLIPTVRYEIRPAE